MVGGPPPPPRPSAAGPSAAGPSAAGPSAAGPSAAGPSAAGPSAAGPSAAGPSAAGPSAAGPSAAGPSAAGPSAAGPSAAGPSAAGPSAAGPSAVGPSAAGGFAVRHERATAAGLLRRPWPDPAVRSVWFAEVERATLVLGSTQSDAVVDRSRASAAGVEVVRRRSGGGAVLLRPGETVWADVLIPAGDPLAEADVGRAFAWVGRAWAAALEAVGVAGAAVHDGPPRPTAWSTTVCFAGLGPGEVTVGGAKVVGISQRRTRAGSLFQCGALVVWHPGPLLDLLALTDDDRRAGLDALATVAVGVGEVGVGVGPARLMAAFEAALHGS